MKIPVDMNLSPRWAETIRVAGIDAKGTLLRHLPAGNPMLEFLLG